MTHTSDGDSGDSKVVAKSVEGEDDMVDVAMKDASAKGAQQGPTILKRFNTKRPAWVKPDEFLDPRMQNLFELSYFSDQRNSDGPIATGWGSVEDHRQYPTIASRLPESEMPVDHDSPSNESCNNANGSDNESGSDETPNNLASQTRMADESSEEDPVSYKVCSNSRPWNSVECSRRTNRYSRTSTV